MVMIVNKSVRVLNIGGTVVTPGIPVEIDKSFLDNERVKELMEAGEIEELDGSTPQPTQQPASSMQSTTKEPPKPTTTATTSNPPKP